jgi:hypothetical protein
LLYNIIQSISQFKETTCGVPPHLSLKKGFSDKKTGFFLFLLTGRWCSLQDATR